MSYQILSNDIEPEKINSVVFHPLQSFQWGQARKEMGTKILRIGEFKDNKLVDAVTISIHPIPHTTFNIGYVPRSKNPSNELLEFIKSLKKEFNFIFVKFEPDEYVGLNISSNLKKSSHPLFPNWTQSLSLSPNEDELLKKLKPKTRYNIKVAMKNNVLVKEESDENGYKTFEKLYFETVKRQTYHGHGKKYHRIVWDNMKDGISHILIARYNNEPLSAYELFLFKNKLYYPYGGSTQNHKNLMASNLLMWEAIKFGKSKGATEFDMWGSLPPDYNPKSEWSGFTKFKQGYGTEFKQFVGSFDLVLNPMLYKIYNTAYFIRDLLLRSRVL